MVKLQRIKQYAKLLGIKIKLESEAFLEGSGGLYIAPDKIYIDKHMDEDLIVLAALHELGHAISERLNEISKREHEIYAETYPETILEEDLDEKDKDVIRFIEARAIFHANILLKKIGIDIDPKIIEKDNLYTVLALEVILVNGILTEKDINQLDKECDKLLRKGITWKNFYNKFL